jgi:hypothetical protein
MADLRIIGQTTSKARVGNGANVGVTGTRDGAIYVADYIQALAMEGRIFHVSHGTITTPITFLAYAAKRPVFALDVPTGTAVIPTRIDVFLESAAGTVTEIIAGTVGNVLGAGTSTALTPACTRTDRPVASNCSAYGNYTADSAAFTNDVEFWRAGTPIAAAAGVPNLYTWKISDGNPQVLVGASALYLFVAATSTQATGFVKVTYAEVPSSAL